MNFNFKSFSIGFLSALIIGTSFSFALADWQSIYVAFNAAEVHINGQKLESDIITYEGTTYAPVRALSESLGKQVEWDEENNAVLVEDKTFSSESLFGDISSFVQTLLGVIVGGLITYVVIVKRAIRKLVSETRPKQS